MSIPITILIDDPAPLINVYWWHAAESQKTDSPTQKDEQPVARDIPVSFLEQFCDVIEEHQILGKFSVLPYPAGLGSIADGWEGCDKSDLNRWIEIVRQRVVPLMDISPEILTHAQAVDLKTMALLDENEREWSFQQTEATLTPYIALSLQILNEVGLPANGITSPWDFGSQVEDAYQRAIRTAMIEVNNRTQSWFFLPVQTKGTEFLSKVVHREDENWLVRLCSQCDDYLWQTMDTLDTSDEYISTVADYFVTEDGTDGRMAELFHAGTPVVFHTHWQSLYSNGRATGLRALAEVANRIRQAWGIQAEWVRCLQFAESIAEGQIG
jgi:hypothetical protein